MAREAGESISCQPSSVFRMCCPGLYHSKGWELVLPKGSCGGDGDMTAHGAGDRFISSSQGSAWKLKPAAGRYLKVVYCFWANAGASNGLCIWVVHCSCNLWSKNLEWVLNYAQNLIVHVLLLCSVSVIFEELSCVLLNWLCFLLRWQLRECFSVCLTKCCVVSEDIVFLVHIISGLAELLSTYALVHSCFSTVYFLVSCACIGWLI